MVTLIGYTQPPLAVAIVPSNQQYNRVCDGRDEAAQVWPAAMMLTNCLPLFSNIVANIFPGEPERDIRPGRFPSLTAQTEQAAGWLDRYRGKARTLAVHMHTDSGVQSHVGAYFGGNPSAESASLASVLLHQCLLPQFRTDHWLTADYGAEGYIAWTHSHGHTTVLLELGSHVNPNDVAILQTDGPRIAGCLAAQIAKHYGLLRLSTEV